MRESLNVNSLCIIYFYYIFSCLEIVYCFWQLIYGINNLKERKIRILREQRSDSVAVARQMWWVRPFSLNCGARPPPVVLPFLFFSPLLNRSPHRSDKTSYLFHFESSHLCTYTAARTPTIFHSIRHFRIRCLSYTYYHIKPLLSRESWWKIVIRRPLNGESNRYYAIHYNQYLIIYEILLPALKEHLFTIF